MSNPSSIVSWSLPSAEEMQAIRIQAEEMRAEYLRSLFSRLFASLFNRRHVANGALTGQRA